MSDRTNARPVRQPDSPAARVVARESSAAAAAVVRLQQGAGNRAVASLARNAKRPTKGPVVSGPGVVAPRSTAIRKIVIDANVFDQIFRGNVVAAQTLKELASKHEVYMSWQAFNEWVVNPHVKEQAHRRASEISRHIIDELKIKMAPPAPSHVVSEIRAKNSYLSGGQTKTILAKETDLRVAAEAKALGGEVWSYDSAFRNGAVDKTLGVKVAGETKSLKGVAGKSNAENGLRILGIDKPLRGQLPAAPAAKPPATVPTGSGPASKAPHAPSGSGKVANEVVEEVARPRKLAGLGAKVGKATLALIDGLMPDPTDAIALLINFAESFKAAQEAVRKRNLEKGFAMGWACYVLFPTWERAQTFARTFVEKDVITQIIDAVGIAENAYNEGLVRGFRYGEKHSTAQLDNVRQRALNAVHRSGRTVNGHNLGDGVYQFVRDDVYLFAGALLPATRKVIEDAEARKELRERVEDLRRRREQIDRDYEIDMARK